MKQKKTLAYYLNKMQFFSHKTLYTHPSYYWKSGIYGLVWDDEKSIYVGKSKIVYPRLKNHIEILSANVHLNKSVEHIKLSTGKMPQIALLQETTELKKWEVYWIKKFAIDGWSLLNIITDYKNENGFYDPKLVEDSNGNLQLVVPDSIVKQMMLKTGDDVTFVPSERGIELIKKLDL